MKNFEIACLHMWERKLAGQDANSGAQPMDIGQIDKSEGEDEDPTNSSPSASRQSIPRETRNPGVMRRNRVRGKKKRLCQALPISG